MPVFNTAANIRPQDVVGDYYQGKALRAQIAATEKQTDLMDEELAVRQQNADTSSGNLQMRVEEYARAIQNDLREMDEENRERVSSGARAAAAWFDENPDDVEGATRQFGIGSGLDPEELSQFGAIEPHEAYGLVAAQDYELDGAGGSEFERLIAGLPQKDRERLTRMRAEKMAAPTSDGSTTRERKIGDVARMLDGDAETATKIVDGHITMSQNEKTGMIELMDKVTGEAWEVPLTYDEVPTAEPEPGKTLWDLAGHATGPMSAIKAVGNIPAAWLGLRTASKVTQARQTFRTTGQNFIRALSINPRFPVGEQERIREEIALVPAVFDAPSVMRDRMVSLNGDLRLRMDQSLADSKNTKLPEDTRKSQASNANEIKNFLAIMGVPDLGATAPDYVTGEDRELWGSYSESDRTVLYPQYGE